MVSAVSTVLKYLRFLKGEEIARRYFVMNSFDGALTMLGVITAFYLAGVNEARIVIISCLGAAIALGVSGVWSAYATERAERIREVSELEKHLLRSLCESRIKERMNVLIILIALVNGVSPVLVSVIIISPFILVQLGLLVIQSAFIAAVTLVFIILFLLGTVTGKVGKESIYYSGAKMVLAGIVVGVICFILEGLKVIQ